jgi:type II secretory pathway component PulF
MIKKWYTYEAINTLGRRHGSLLATSKNAAHKQLCTQFEKVVTIERRKSLRDRDFWIFLSLLHELLGQNCTLTQSLLVLKEQESKGICYAARQIENLISEGSDLINAMMVVFPNVPELHLSILQIGYENAGLSRSLDVIIEQKKERDEHVRQAKKTVAYPLFLLATSIAVLVVVFDVILPSMRGIVEGSENTFTEIIFTFSGKGLKFLNYLIWLSALLLGIAILAYRTNWLREPVERVVLETPIIGKILREYIKGLFLQNIAIALELKSDLQSALRMSVKYIPSFYFKRVLAKVEFDVLEGQSFTKALSHTSLFRKDELSRIAIGEETSNLGDVINRIYLNNRRERESRIAIRLQLLGPITVVLLGIIVFTIAYIVMQPMMAIQQRL